MPSSPETSRAPSPAPAAEPLDRVVLRPALSPPQSSVPGGLIRRVVLRHPGYADEANVLLSLQAPDHPAGGLHHETARLACAPVAGNRWDGFLSNPTAPPTATRPDGILRAPEYYFHLPNPPLEPPYPVVSRFSDWRFPHRQLPPSWTALSVDVYSVPIRSQLSAAISARDATCRISAHGEGVELAHLVPRSEDERFHRSGMGQYLMRDVPHSLGHLRKSSGPTERTGDDWISLLTPIAHRRKKPRRVEKTGLGLPEEHRYDRVDPR